MRRPGVTLVEVLAAIGIMAIGMLAVLVLFPVGALSIAKALKDDRCGTIAGNGHAIAAAMLIGNDNTDLDAVPATNPTFGIYNVLDENYVPPQEKPTDPVYQRSNPKSLGYPVYVDPFYVYSGVTGNTGDPNELPAKYLVYRHVARRSPLYLRQLTNVGDRNAVMERHYAFTDDFTFTANGYPKLERQGLYTWAYMIRRIRADSPSTVQMQIVVYSGRPIEAPEAEESYRLVTPVGEGATSFELTWRNDPNPAVPRVTRLEERPELRRGMWLYDSTYTPLADANGTVHGYVNGCFYRIMDVTDSENGTSVQIEVQPPLRMPDPKNATFQARQMTLMRGVVEVFERGNLRE